MGWNDFHRALHVVCTNNELNTVKSIERLQPHLSMSIWWLLSVSLSLTYAVMYIRCFQFFCVWAKLVLPVTYNLICLPAQRSQMPNHTAIHCCTEIWLTMWIRWSSFTRVCVCVHTKQEDPHLDNVSKEGLTVRELFTSKRIYCAIDMLKVLFMGTTTIINHLMYLVYMNYRVWMTSSKWLPL